MKNTLGIQIIHELQLRKMAGRYFKFREIQKLKKVTDQKQLDEFLNNTSYDDIEISSNPSEIVEQLTQRKESYDWFIFVTDVLINLTC